MNTESGRSIYINGRFLTQPMTGTERYAYQVCKTMATLGTPFTIVCPKQNIHPCYDVSNLPIVQYGRGTSHIWEQFVLPFFFFGKKDYILLSFTGLGPVLIRDKVMTIHDLSFLENPKWFSRAYYWWYKIMTPLVVRTSLHILTVSEFSKQEILRFYPFTKSQDITVVYCAPNKSLFRTLEHIPPAKERFVLAVSSLDPRKNFNRLIEAFSVIKTCKLYIVGTHHHAFNQTVNTQSVNTRYLGRVSDDELATLYNQAEGFIFPSLYEGFGLPPIEAMCCGCPVLNSDIPVLKEVSGSAAIYFNPYKSEDIKEAIEQYLSHADEYKKKLRILGYENANRFSWEKSTKAIISLINEISTHTYNFPT